MKIRAWKAMQSGSLRGFVTVEFPSGAVFHECPTFEKDERWWATPAAKPRLNRGTVVTDENNKAKYDPVVSFRDKDTANKWSDAVIQALRDAGHI